MYDPRGSAVNTGLTDALLSSFSSAIVRPETIIPHITSRQKAVCVYQFLADPGLFVQHKKPTTGAGSPFVGRVPVDSTRSCPT